MKKFMADLETTGPDTTSCEILEIGILELNRVDKFWQPGKEFQLTQFYDGPPPNPWALEHQSELYARCNKAERTHPKDIHDQLISYFKECGAEPPEVYLMGWNLVIFDIPIFVRDGILKVANQDNPRNRLEGDIHYRVYEMSGALDFCCDVFRIDRNTLINMAVEAYPEIGIPAGRVHEAIYDCYKQTACLNGLIRLLSR